MHINITTHLRDLDLWSTLESKEELGRRLFALGMDADEVTRWVAAGQYVPIDEHVAVIRAWQHAFGCVRGVAWYETAMPLDEAVRWGDAGYEPAQAEFVQWALLWIHHSHRDVPFLLQEESRWLGSGLTPSQVCHCLRSGIESVDEALRHFTTADGDASKTDRHNGGGPAGRIEP